MRRLVFFFILLAALIGGHLFTLNQLTSNRHGLVRQSEELTALPPAAIKLLSLDYRNLVSDLIFSRTVSFYGGMVNRREKVNSETWQRIYERLDLASELDPYFVDPYFFGQAVLTWAAGMAKEANALLERGYQYRIDDWTIPFFIGFNHFYFLHDNTQAAVYLMEASKRPGSSPLVGLLAARLASKGGGIETSIAFLHQLEQQTEDEATRKQIHDRRMALKGIWVLEQVVERYRQRFGKRPRDLQGLVEKGLLDQIPIDPYGGTYYITAEGKVWTTSDLRPVKKTE
jgi:hypothetical protein